MVKYLFCPLFFIAALSASVVEVFVPSGAVLNWQDYSGLGSNDTLQITLPDSSGNVQLIANASIVITPDIQCNGELRITDLGNTLHVQSTISAPQIILEAKRIYLDSIAILDASESGDGGSIFVGGGWLGEDPSIHNAGVTIAREGSQLLADSLLSGSGGTVVLWADKICGFEGFISAQGKGGGNGGSVEVSSAKFLHFDGNVNVESQGGSSGSLFLDPVSITIQASNPDIDGNGTNLDITGVTQLDDATTTPAGFPNAASIITTGALSSLMTNNVSLTLAAQNFITVNAAISPPGSNVTFTLEAPTINLNSPITLASGGVLTGVGVTTVNVGASGLPQNGVDVASNGTTVNLASATYTPPINIVNKNITLSGNGPANTLIRLPHLHSIPSHSSRNPLIYVNGSSSATIQNLTVDGNYVGYPVNPNIVGIFYSNSGGAISGCKITKIANEPPPYFGGGQQGNAIRVSVTSGGPYSIAVDSTTMDLFQKGGMVLSGSPLNVSITNNTVTGYGSPIHLGSNGIQISSGATGSISNNSVTGLQYTDHQSCVGILAFDAGSNLQISGNTADNNDEGILSVESASLVIENNIAENSGDGGVVILDSTDDTQILSNTVFNNGGLSGPSGINAGIYILSTTAETFEISQNAITTAPGASAIVVEGSGSGTSPSVTLLDNTFP